MRARVRADVTVHMLPVSVHIADSLQFDLTSLAVISNSGNFTSFFLAGVHFSPLAEYCHSFQIFHTSHSCLFHEAYN